MRFSTTAMAHYGLPVSGSSRATNLAGLIAAARWRNRITEVSINGPHDVWVHLADTGYRQVPAAEVTWATRDYFEHLAQVFAVAYGIEFSTRSPSLACRTPDGHRLQLVTGETTGTGVIASLRIKRLMDADWSDFAISNADRDRLVQSVVDGKAIVISGGTGSGKTTFANLLGKQIPADRRIVTVEDTKELDLQHKNQINFFVSRTRSESLIGYTEIIDAIVRLNPDVILCGELSIQNAFPCVQLMDTGHEAFLTTMHANSPLDALRGFRRRVALGGAAATEVGTLMEFLADNIALIAQIGHEAGCGGQPPRRILKALAEPKALLARRTGGLTDESLSQDGTAATTGMGSPGKAEPASTASPVGMNSEQTPPPPSKGSRACV